MNKLQIIVLAVAFLHIGVNSAVYDWVTTDPSSVALLQPTPDGFENNTAHLYACRILADTGRWVAGKLLLGSERTGCAAGTFGKEHWSEDFQILITAPGATSWIPSNGKVPANAVKGGVTREGISAYLCRALYNGSLLIGGTVSNRYCWMAYGGQEVSANANIEILVVNGYGQKLEEAGFRVNSRLSVIKE